MSPFVLSDNVSAPERNPEQAPAPSPVQPPETLEETVVFSFKPLLLKVKTTIKAGMKFVR